MGSADQRSIVNQLEGEMEELHHLQYSTDFSTDVNRKMQVPPRLSMEPQDPFLEDPPSPKQNFNFDASNFDGSPAHAMNVPERIFMAGSDQHVGARQAPRDLDLDRVPAFTQAGNNVGLTTPPRVLTLDEFSFPTVGDAKSALKGKSANNAVRQPMDPNSSVVDMENSSVVEAEPNAEWEKIQRRVYLLTSKVAHLEVEGKRRDKRDQIFMGIGIVYLLFKGLRFLFRSPYP